MQLEERQYSSYKWVCTKRGPEDKGNQGETSMFFTLFNYITGANEDSKLQLNNVVIVVDAFVIVDVVIVDDVVVVDPVVVDVDPVVVDVVDVDRDVVDVLHALQLHHWTK